jgi:hypothetical protein
VSRNFAPFQQVFQIPVCKVFNFAQAKLTLVSRKRNMQFNKGAAPRLNSELCEAQARCEIVQFHAMFNVFNVFNFAQAKLTLVLC